MQAPTTEIEGEQNEYIKEFMEAEGWNSNGRWNKIDEYLELPLKERVKMEEDRPWDIRKYMVGKYAWAIPNERAIKMLVELGPIVEVGAGIGYWAHLVTEAGGDIRAYDSLVKTYKESCKDPWFPVKRGGVEKARMKGRNLFLCWPPYSEKMATRCLENCTGQYVIYVGEGEGGCTGDEDFHEHLDKHFKMVTEFAIPQWWGLHDDFQVWERTNGLSSR